jgi:DNA-binding IclR family transcriptional regulator
MKDLSGTLPKALIILRFMASQQGEVSFQQIKNHSSLSSNVLSRILKTYLEWGFFTKNAETGFYSLGHESLNLAKMILKQNSLQDLANEAVKDLAELTGESAAFFEFDENLIKLIAKKEMANSYHYLKLMSSEIHTANNAFIYSILPFVSSQVSDHFIKNSDGAFNFEKTKLSKDFDEIRKDKFLVRQERYQRAEISRFCALVFIEKEIVGSVGVTVNSHSLDKQDKEQILQQCLSAARSIEEKL